MPRKQSVDLEKKIETDILTFLKYRFIYSWKNNSTGVYDPVRKVFRRNKNPFVINGVADILGVLNDGRLLAIEVKRPGKNATPDQRKFLDKIKLNGGVCGVCRSVKDARELIDEATGHVQSGAEERDKTKGISE